MNLILHSTDINMKGDHKDMGIDIIFFLDK